jgi:CRISPR-associated protein Cas1
MRRNYYIFSSGKLIRRQNTLYFEPGIAEEPVEIEENQDDEIEVEDNTVSDTEETEEPRRLPRKPIPVEDIEAIYCFSELRFNTKFVNFLAQKQITLHLFNYYGYYTGSFYPREPFISGNISKTS